MARVKVVRREPARPPGRRVGSFPLALAALIALPAPVYAHGFGQRYDLPVPLWLYLAGAGATVGFSFVMVAAFLPAPKAHERQRQLALPRGGKIGAWIAALLRAAALATFALVVVAGLTGNQSPFKNIAPTMVWIVGWVGLTFVSAAIGDVWAAINPWDTVARLAAAWFRRKDAGRAPAAALGSARPLDAWPAIALFLIFAWCELVWDESDRPRSLALALLAYSAVTWAGMSAFGRARWLQCGEIFAIAFGLFGRFAPFAQRGDGEEARIVLRPYAAGLLSPGRPESPALTGFVLLLLATVTFDGILETPSWAALAAAARPIGMGPQLAATLGLIALPLVFLGAYLGVIALIARLVVWKQGIAALAGFFVTTFVPIALAYDAAHNVSYLSLGIQYLIPILSDPFGVGWDLFGTTLYLIDTGVVTASGMWYIAIAAIVGGHVIAVYLAHAQALRIFPDRDRALRSQIPLVLLMIAYTMLSLWILAQPITNIRP